MSITPQDTWLGVGTKERRLHARRHLTFLAYAELSNENGGIILDLSEGGMVVAAAEPFGEAQVLDLRFQLPGASGCIETRGEIVWISESKREAGLRFVGLSEPTRNRLKQWLSSEVSPPVFREKGRAHEKNTAPLEVVSTRENKSVIPAGASQQRVVERFPLAAVPAPKLVGAPSVSVTPVPEPLAHRGAVPHEAVLKPGKDATNPSAGSHWQRHVIRNFVAATLLILATVLSVTFVIRKAASNAAIKSSAAKKAPSDPAKGVQRPAASAAANSGSSSKHLPKGEAPVSGNARTVPRAAAEDKSPHWRAVDSGHVIVDRNVDHPARVKVDTSSRPAGAKRVGAEPKGPITPAEGLSPRSIERGPAPSEEVSNASLGSKGNQPEGAAAPSNGGKEVAPTAKPPETPPVVKGSVSVSFSPYPSIRIPAEMRSQMSRQGASLQIGQLVSRTDPIYPEDAERQGIEGTVKLHVIIGRDGTVEGVALISGPPALVEAATGAIRQWRYKPASLGGQPIEAEQDITIVFRLVK